MSEDKKEEKSEPENWECKYCMNINSNEADFCSKCGKKKPDKDKMPNLKDYSKEKICKMIRDLELEKLEKKDLIDGYKELTEQRYAQSRKQNALEVVRKVFVFIICVVIIPCGIQLAQVYSGYEKHGVMDWAGFYDGLVPILSSASGWIMANIAVKGIDPKLVEELKTGMEENKGLYEQTRIKAAENRALFEEKMRIEKEKEALKDKQITELQKQLEELKNKQGAQ